MIRWLCMLLLLLPCISLAADRHAELISFNVQPASPDCQHAQRTSGRGMAVGAEQCFARNSEALHVHRMADPIARATVPNTKLTAGAT